MIWNSACKNNRGVCRSGHGGFMTDDLVLGLDAFTWTIR
jgi:hypothetical protein